MHNKYIQYTYINYVYTTFILDVINRMIVMSKLAINHTFLFVLNVP